MATLEHQSSVHYYGPNVPTTSSLHRPHSTAGQWFPSEAVPSSTYPHTARLEHLSRHPPFSTRLWCQTQLCLLTVGLSLLVTLNAALLLWILSYLNFDNFVIEDNPMHPMYSKSANTKSPSISSSSNRLAIHGGLRVTSGHLEANSVAASNGAQLHLMSRSSLVFGPQNMAAGQLPWLQMGAERMVAQSCNLVVKSAVNENLLLLLQSPTDDPSGAYNAVVGVDSIQIRGPSGLLLNSSIQVPTLQSADELFLYSPNQRIQFRGPKQVNILLRRTEGTSLAANTSIRLTSAAQVKLESTHHQILFNVSTLQFSPRLLTVHPSKHGRTYPSIGQLCVCAQSGKIFMAGHYPRSCLQAAQYECTT